MYEYLAASMPAVTWGVPAPVSLEEFMTQCRRDMRPQDTQDLSDLLAWFPVPLGRPRPLPVAYSWAQSLAESEQTLRREVAELRMAHRNTHGHKSVVLSADVTDAASPLAAEMALLRHWWDTLALHEQHEWWGQLQHFVWYGLRLKLVTHMQSFNADSGTAAFDALCAAGAKGGDS